ncbi:MAG: ATP-grasp domain-containing protein [Clostridiales bacterium]|nr:ATP-grasp domain-containing protein [Clostridiales bacterium]
MKALVLAGGFPQIALIEELKSRGITVVLADWNDEPVAKKFADKYYQVSTLDIDAVEKVAKQESVDFLVTVCTDQALHTVAYVSEKLGLPCYIDYQTALNVTNKAYMKKVFNKHGISTAKHVIMGEFDENKIKDMPYPLIVKPVDCNSSKGVKRVENIDELKVAFNDAVNFSRTKTAVVEQFIDGPEISVDLYVENGKAKVLCVSKNDKIADKNKFVIFRGLCPVKEAQPVLDKIQFTAQQIVDAFGLKNTPMLIQFITDGKEVYVLEFSARTGGGTKYLRIKLLQVLT